MGDARRFGGVFLRDMTQLTTLMPLLPLFSLFPHHSPSSISEDFVVLEGVQVIVGCQIWFTRLD